MKKIFSYLFILALSLNNAITLKAVDETVLYNVENETETIPAEEEAIPENNNVLIEKFEVSEKAELTLQEQLNASVGDVVITLTKSASDSSALMIPTQLNSVFIDLNNFSISKDIYANGVPLTLKNGKVGAVYGGGYNQNVENTNLTLENIRVNTSVYGGGHSDHLDTPANVFGSTTINSNDSIFAEELPNHVGVGNSGYLYGGGFAEKGGTANAGATSVNVDGGVLYSVYGGGHGINGTANVENQAHMDLTDTIGYGDVLGCGFAEKNNASTTCGSVDLVLNRIYLPTAQGAFNFQTCDIYGGSMTYDTGANLQGQVYGEVNLEITDSKTHGYLIGGGASRSLGTFFVGSINLSVKGVKDYFEERVGEVLRNQRILLEGFDEECLGDIHVAIEDTQTDSIYTTKRDVPLTNKAYLKIKSAMELSELQGISELILEEPLTIIDKINLNNEESIKVVLDKSWDKDMHAISIPKYDPDLATYFIGDNIEFVADEVNEETYWKVLEDLHPILPPIDPPVDPPYKPSVTPPKVEDIKHDEQGSQLQLKGNETVVSKDVVKALVKDNATKPVTIESKQLRVTYPAGAMGDIGTAIDLKVVTNENKELAQKVIESTKAEVAITVEFPKGEMFSSTQPIALSVKIDGTHKGKELYYQKIDPVTNKLLLIQPSIVEEDGWVSVLQSSAGNYVLTDTIPASWQLSESGNWYSFNDSGHMDKGWVASGDNWFYQDDSGKMKTGWMTDKDNTQYYLSDHGAMHKGWVASGSNWYYLDSSGKMMSDSWQTIDGVSYYFDSKGQMSKD